MMDSHHERMLAVQLKMFASPKQMMAELKADLEER
jgi:hypothetical protein